MSSNCGSTVVKNMFVELFELSSIDKIYKNTGLVKNSDFGTEFDT